MELVDYDWPDDEPNPRSGIVRAHNKSHDKLYEQISRLEYVGNDAVVYVGKPKANFSKLSLATIFMAS